MKIQYSKRKKKAEIENWATVVLLSYYPRVNFAAMDAANDLFVRWMNLEQKLVARFGKKPDLESILFLIGVQEFGQLKENFTKEQKQDLMHVAVCSLLSQSGYFEFEQFDKDGWPHFKQLKAMPNMSMREQEDFIKDHVLLYFEQSGL
jgi:hypothetical protein